MKTRRTTFVLAGIALACVGGAGPVVETQAANSPAVLVTEGQRGSSAPALSLDALPPPFRTSSLCLNHGDSRVHPQAPSGDTVSGDRGAESRALGAYRATYVP